MTIQKISGVLFVTDATATPKSYFGATGKFQASTDGTTIQINIGADSYNTAYGGLTVGTSTAASMSEALVLLNSIFGT